MRDFELPGRSAVHSLNAMAATSHPLATATANDILKAGGNALDAAIAASAVLCVVEAQSTGIGGDCFVLMTKPGGGPVIGYNGSGRSVAASTLKYFQDNNITEITETSPHSVTVPGAIDAWATLHGDHGKLDFASLMAPAIAFARDGYPIHGRVHRDWVEASAILDVDEHAKALFKPNGKIPAEGDIHRQPKLAETLGIIATEGRKGFYEGAVAKSMVQTLNGKGGLHTLEDFAVAKGDYVTPITSSYRGYDIHQIPPNNQGMVALMMLNILEGFDLTRFDPLSVERTHLEIEAGRLAFAVRNAAITDIEHMHDDPERLVSKAYAEQLRSNISLDRAMSDIPDLGLRKSDTVYLSVVDKDGMAVSFINSVYHSFGSGILCPQTGVMFQNRGMSFCLDAKHPNCMAPNKRPMHTIMPGMLTKGDKTVMSYGVMGGDYQPFGHTRLLTNVIDYGLDVQTSLDMPRVFAMGQDVEIEKYFPQTTLSGLIDKGHKLSLAEAPHGGGQAIYIDHERGVLTGGSDPRKDGCALGY